MKIDLQKPFLKTKRLHFAQLSLLIKVLLGNPIPDVHTIIKIISLVRLGEKAWDNWRRPTLPVLAATAAVRLWRGGGRSHVKTSLFHVLQLHSGPAGDESRAPICKRLRNPGIDSKASIPPAFVAWRSGTSNRVVIPVRQAGNRFLGSLKGVQIRVLFNFARVFRIRNRTRN
jgi:hypothetical protein